MKIRTNNLYFLPKYSSDLNKGFTLIELLVVIAIIGTLSSIVMVTLGTARRKSNDALRISQLNQIGRALEMYYADNGKYPSWTNGTFMYADSRNPPNTALPAYSNLMSQLVPNYLPVIPYPPFNGKKEGLMCNNCDEYIYQASSYGVGYMICGYMAEDHGGSGWQGANGSFYGTNTYGPYYCWSNSCGAGSGPSGTSFATCKN